MGPHRGCVIFSGPNCNHTYARSSGAREFCEDEHSCYSGKILLQNEYCAVVWSSPGLVFPWVMAYNITKTKQKKKKMLALRRDLPNHVSLIQTMGTTYP